MALEFEWNSKEAFFARDLNRFCLRFDLRATSAGAIITRCDKLRGIWFALGRGVSYGASVTHTSKLIPRIVGSGGAGWLILAFGRTKSL